MQIEIGKTYTVSAYNKKSLYEIEMYKHEETNKCLNTEVTWRNGTFIVRIENEDEAEYLQKTIGDDGDIWDWEDYSNIEMDSTYDGCAEEFVFYGSGETEWSDEESESLEDGYWEAMDEGDIFGTYDYLEDLGYDSLGCNYQIHHGTVVEVAEEELEALDEGS